MRVTVLGKYGPFAKMGGATSGYLVSGNGFNILLDAGSGVSSRLISKIDLSELTAVCLSHLHFDHIADIGVLNYMLESKYRGDESYKKIKLFIPKVNSKIFDIISELKYFEVISVDVTTVINLDGVLLKFYKMVHPEPDYAVKITAEGKTFSYSGDSTLAGDFMGLLEGSDFLLADGAFLESNYYEGKPHASCCQIAKLGLDYGVKVLISHLNPNIKEEDYLKDILKVNKEAKLAEEMKEYEI